MTIDKKVAAPTSRQIGIEVVLPNKHIIFVYEVETSAIGHLSTSVRGRRSVACLSTAICRNCDSVSVNRDARGWGRTPIDPGVIDMPATVVVGINGTHLQDLSSANVSPNHDGPRSRRCSKSRDLPWMLLSSETKELWKLVPKKLRLRNVQ